MPIIVQTKPGSALAPASPFITAVTLDTPATAGNAVVIGMFSNDPLAVRPPGTSEDLKTGSAQIRSFWRLPVAAGGETSWDVTDIAQGYRLHWCVWEVSGLETIDAVDVNASTAEAFSATLTTLSSGTTGAGSSTDPLCLAVHVYVRANWPGSGGTFATWSGQTNGFVEDVDWGAAVGTTYHAAAFSHASPGVAGPWETTATFSTDATRSASEDAFSSAIIVYRALGQVVERPGTISVT